MHRNGALRRHWQPAKGEELYRFPEDVGPIGGNPFAVSSEPRSFLINLLDRNDKDLKLVENFR